MDCISKEDFLAHAPTLAPIKGYQQKAFTADGGRLRMVYLRNTGSPYSFLTNDGAGGKAELFSLRMPCAVPFDVLGLDPAYRARLYDLDARAWTELDPARPSAPVLTDHDFVLICERK